MTISHQFVSHGHVDDVRRSQLELQCIDVDVTQHKPHKLIFCIIAILHSGRQQAESRSTNRLIRIKPAKQLLKCNRFNFRLNITAASKSSHQLPCI